MDKKLLQNLFELEYNKLDQAPVIKNLNILLASYEVFLYKLRVYFWNITGQDYFNLRREFKDIYQRAFDNSEQVAERLRIFDQTPAMLLKDITRLSRIKENDRIPAGFEMVKDLLNNYLILISIIKDCMKTARDTDDGVTEAMMKNLMYEMEKDHQSLLSWLK
jgi:starvation-inducible DNA-binding protein